MLSPLGARSKLERLLLLSLSICSCSCPFVELVTVCVYHKSVFIARVTPARLYSSFLTFISYSFLHPMIHDLFFDLRVAVRYSCQC